MTTSPDSNGLSRMELLVLARLSGGKKPPSENEIAKDMITFALPDATQAEARQRVDGVLASLRERGLVEKERVPTRRVPKRSPRPSRDLSDHGKKALCNAFGATKVPSWQEVRDKYLPAVVLETAKAPTTSDGLQAKLLAPQLGVEDRGSMSKLLDDVVASELGIPPGPLTLEKIRAHLLARRAGVEARGKAREIAARLAAKALRAPRGDLKHLRIGLLRKWAAGDAHDALTSAASSAPLTSPVQAPEPPTTIDDGEFASLVQDAAHDVGPDGRFGSQKVFISAVWEQLHERLDISLDELKRRLLDANRRGALSLARADLVGAMDPSIVARSEIADANASFHFVIDSGRR